MAETMLSKEAFKTWLRKQPKALKGGCCPIQHWVGRDEYLRLYADCNGKTPGWMGAFFWKVDSAQPHILWADEGTPYSTAAVLKVLESL